MVTYSISKTNANIGETVTVSRSENINICYTFWVIDLQPSDYSCSFLQGANNLNSKGKIFSYHNSLSKTVTLSDRHTITHKLTPITVGVPVTQYISGILTTPIYEMQSSSIYTVDIGEPIEVNFNRNIYNQLKFLVNRWTKGKENTNNKVTSISSSSTDVQYPSAKLVYDTIETKLDKLQRTVTTFNPIDYVVGENGAVWNDDDTLMNDDDTLILRTNGNTITFNFTDMLNDIGDYFEWELKSLHGTAYMVDDTHSDEIWNSSVNSMIRIRITKNQGSDSYHITTTDLSNNTIIKDYDKDYSFNLTFLSLNGVTISFSNKKWYHTVSFIDIIYPIGSIYMSVNSINPSLFIGGTWEQIQDRFLLASGFTYSAGSTGGSSKVALTKAQMPRHNHTQAQHRHKQANKYSDGSGSAGAYVYSSNRKATDHYTDYQTPVINHTGGTGTTNVDANGSPHENMPPYLTVYMWKRIA